MSIEQDIRRLLEGAKNPISNETVIPDEEVVEEITELDEAKETFRDTVARYEKHSGKKAPAGTSHMAMRIIANKAENDAAANKKSVQKESEEVSDDQIVEGILALDELSKKTLGSYVKNASWDAADKASQSHNDLRTKDQRSKSFIKSIKRLKKIATATDKLTKEQKESVGEILEELEREDMISVDVSEDIDALMNGEDLSEEFKTKATTIFEAAVVTRVKEEISRIEESFEARLNEEVESMKEGLAEKVDGYLNYIVEKWIEDNEIALTHGIKNEIMENFISGIKGVFEANYIDVPEEKFDVVSEMETKLSELESKLNESVEANVKLHSELGEIRREKIIAEASDGLSDTQVEKFKSLSEELSYEDEESFIEKLKTIRENYFSKKPSTRKITESFITDEPITEEVQKVFASPAMNHYMQALNK